MKGDKNEAYFLKVFQFWGKHWMSEISATTKMMTLEISKKKQVYFQNGHTFDNH